MAASDTCPICLQKMVPQEMGEKNGYILVACAACGSVMTQKPVEAAEREQFLADIEPQITHVPNPQAEIDNLKKLISKVMPESKGKSFLDINCRNGYAVMAAKELGFTVKGIDSHGFFIDFAKSKYPPELFELATITDAAQAGVKADFIFVRDAYGDQLDVDAFTKALGQILAPHGVIYIEEHDGNHFNVPKYFPSWAVVFPPMNFYYFSKKGLASVLKRHGLKVTRKYFNWRPLMRVIAEKK